MLSTGLAAWRNLVKRLSADWLILTAGTVTILLAMVLLAAGPIYAEAVTESALGRTLTEAAPADSTVVLEVRTPPSEFDTVDDLATRAIANAFAGVDVTITRVLEAEPVELPDGSDDHRIDLAQVRSMERIDEHASLIDGSWPESGLQAALPASTADQLGLQVGQRVVLTNPRDREAEIELALVGTYQVDDRADPYWLDDRLTVDGVVQSAGFRTFGPFVVAQGSVAEITPRATAVWRAHPEFDTLEVDEAATVRGRVTALSRSLGEAVAVVDGPGNRFSEFSVDTGLDRLLSGTGRSLTVTRSSVVGLLIQLALLAGYALALTAGLLVDVRRAETFLVSSRGASPGHMVAVAGFEAILLSVPAALAAPAVAAWTLDALARFGPLAPVGLDFVPGVTPESRVIVAFAAVAAVAALVWPAWRSARSVSGFSRRDARQRTSSGAQRAWVDLALVGLAVLAFWQLEALGSQISSTVQGRFGVDPILIAAPTLGLLAGSVLALRIVPLLARIAERVAAAGRASVPALSAWQVARRPLRYARSALLLIMAVAIGFFAASYSASWVDSQRDQADFQVGADLRVQPNRRTGDSITDLQLVSAHESIDGVDRSMPLVRRTGALPGSETPGELVRLDADAAAEVVSIRDDLAPDFAALMGQLAEARPVMPGVEIPGGARRLGLVVEASEAEATAPEGQVLVPAFRGRVGVVLQDADGLLHRLDLGAVAVNDGPQTLEADLAPDTGEGAVFGPAYPLRVVSIEIDSVYPFISRQVTFDLIDMLAAGVPGDWESLDFDPSADSWIQETVRVGEMFLQVPPGIREAEEQPDDLLRLDIDTGFGFGGLALFVVRPPFSPEGTYPVVVSNAWLEVSNRDVGDEMVLDGLASGGSRAVIVGAVEVFPTAGGDVILADLATLEVHDYAGANPIDPIEEHWLSVSGDPDSVAEALLAPPFESVGVEGRDERFLALSTDPVALGTIGGLTIGFIAAAIFAAVGFAVSATVSARERITEFGLLRALGLSPRQLAAWVTLEQGVLVVSSLAFGTLVGWVLTTSIVPLVTVTQQGARPVPEVSVVYPWGAALLLQAGLVTVLGVVVTVMTLLLRRLGLGSLLRLGEE